ncbi:MAG: molybdenum cofactor biosynthesis protein MoaE [Phaeodactylibacter sp.]|nr:molybdenum cofactor biosynthesis protein MoaE [Phaeodactylibacter sp.]MCB9273002.1 molybdenum cofactor biosynthesis protein MoaE [Lewinellaceae bacterium]
MTDIQLLSIPLQPQACIGFVSGPACGGVNVFIGTVRNQTQGRPVIRLEFEAYEPMAIAEMRKIAEQLKQRWPVERVSFHHRIGVLGPGETAVIIAVSAPHRQASFEACQYAIDTLKQSVPIWKKEIFEDGEVWVAAHP